MKNIDISASLDLCVKAVLNRTTPGGLIPESLRPLFRVTDSGTVAFVECRYPSGETYEVAAGGRTIEEATAALCQLLAIDPEATDEAS